MSVFPKTFNVKSQGSFGVEEKWTNSLVDKECFPIEMAIPPEFEGPGGTYSPEDLYALSLMNCYLATFKYIAQKSKLIFDSIDGDALLFVDKGNSTAPWMERIDINITLNGVSQKERALGLMEKTKSHCMILNSVKTHINYNFHVN